MVEQYYADGLPVRDKSEPAKRIILICDGTWNDATALKKNDPIWTNPQRLADCIRAFDKSENMAQCVIYLRGVGTTTSWLLNHREGIFGKCKSTRLSIGEGNHSIYSILAIKECILLGYHQICLNWTSHNDQIILVGFSRGGYVAMAIARLLQDVGIKKIHYTPQSMDETWKQ